MLRYAVVYERTVNNYGAFSPDVAGCAATAGTLAQAKKLFVQALEAYIESCVETDEQVPEPRLSLADAIKCYTDEVSIDVADEEVMEVTFGWVEVIVPDNAP